MTRVPELDFATLSPEQKRLQGEIGSSHGGVMDRSFAIWLRNPGLADKAHQLRNELRKRGKLDKRLVELIILTISRHWSAQYAWARHEQAALEAGVEGDVVEAIRDYRDPTFSREDEKLTFALVSELNQTQAISDETFERAVQLFGLDLMIELVALVGFYTMVAMTLQAFNAPVQDGRLNPLPV